MICDITVPVVKMIQCTCDACPTQWEGYTEDDVYVYIRYRYGTLSLSLDNEQVFSKSIGTGLDGMLSREEIAWELKEELDFSKVWYWAGTVE